MECNQIEDALLDEANARLLDSMSFDDEVAPLIAEARVDELAARRAARKVYQQVQIDEALETVARLKSGQTFHTSTANSLRPIFPTRPNQPTLAPQALAQRTVVEKFQVAPYVPHDDAAKLALTDVASLITANAISPASVVAPTLMTSAAKTDLIDIYAAEYRFPEDALSDASLELTAMSVAELAGKLHDLSIDMIGKEFVPYLDIRQRVCAISIELNRRGTLAPRFRRLRRPSSINKTAGDLALSRDRQFIDLHWLHCIKCQSPIHEGRPQFLKLLTAAVFDTKIAEMFVETPAFAEEKAEWLALPDHVALQLDAIQSDTIRERYRVATSGARSNGQVKTIGRLQVTAMLKNSVAHQPHLQKEVQLWANIWMCARLVGDHAEVLRNFHALCEGLDKPLDGRDIARRLEKIRARLGEAKAAEKLAA